MIHFFKTPSKSIIAAEATQQLNQENLERLKWLFGEAEVLPGETIEGFFVGPRREMVTPWSTNAVEITSQNPNYALRDLPECLELTHVNLNDGTVEGFRHKTLPALAVQYHPEAAPGPHDADALFDQFAAMLSQRHS